VLPGVRVGAGDVPPGPLILRPLAGSSFPDLWTVLGLVESGSGR
jgi:hypothetical protein